MLKDSFCDEGLEILNLQEAGTSKKERQRSYTSDLIKTISVFSCIGHPLQIALLLL